MMCVDVYIAFMNRRGIASSLRHPGGSPCDLEWFDRIPTANTYMLKDIMGTRHKDRIRKSRGHHVRPYDLAKGGSFSFNSIHDTERAPRQSRWDMGQRMGAILARKDRWRAEREARDAIVDGRPWPDGKRYRFKTREDAQAAGAIPAHREASPPGPRAAARRPAATPSQCPSRAPAAPVLEGAALDEFLATRRLRPATVDLDAYETIYGFPLGPPALQ